MERLMAFSRLDSFLKRRAGALSGGMKQKLALCCTLIHTPEVLFLDEPTTGVDPVSRREFWKMLGELKENGTTIVVSTPYMDEAERCDRVGFIMNGTLIGEGTPSELSQRFTHHILAVQAPGIMRKTRGLTFPEVVHDVRLFGDRLHLTVEDVRSAEPVVRAFLDEHGLVDVPIKKVEPSMEDVFVENMSHA